MFEIYYSYFKQSNIRTKQKQQNRIGIEKLPDASVSKELEQAACNFPFEQQILVCF